MFSENEVSHVFELVNKNEANANNKKLKYIANKIKKYGTYLYINLSELNYLYELAGIPTRYNVLNLKEALQLKNISYTNIIKNTNIPKATLSMLLNGSRNFKLYHINYFIADINSANLLHLSKDLMREGE